MEFPRTSKKVYNDTVHASVVNDIGIKGAEKELILCSCSLSLAQKLLTPLHIAARKGHCETCELLLLKGAEVNARDEVRIKFFLLFAAVGGADTLSVL